MKNQRRKWIAERLKYWRKKFGLQPKDVAEKINVNYKTYTAHEQQRSEPDLFRLKNICDIYNITVDQFLEGSPTTEKTC